MKSRTPTRLAFVGIALSGSFLFGCASSKDVEELRAQVKELQARLAYAQQSALDANRIAVQAAQTANDARMALTNKTNDKKELTTSANSAPTTVARVSKVAKGKTTNKQG